MSRASSNTSRLYTPFIRKSFKSIFQRCGRKVSDPCGTACTRCEDDRRRSHSHATLEPAGRLGQEGRDEAHLRQRCRVERRLQRLRPAVEVRGLGRILVEAALPECPCIATAIRAPPRRPSMERQDSSFRLRTQNPSIAPSPRSYRTRIGRLTWGSVPPLRSTVDPVDCARAYESLYQEALGHNFQRAGEKTSPPIEGCSISVWCGT
jgi:hypothetical protein